MSVDFHLNRCGACHCSPLWQGGAPWGPWRQPDLLSLGRPVLVTFRGDESKAHLLRQQTSTAHCNGPLRRQAPPPPHLPTNDYYLKSFTNRTLPKAPSPICIKNSRSKKLHLQRSTGISPLLPLWHLGVPLLEDRWKSSDGTPDLLLRLEPAVPSWDTMELSRRSSSSSRLGLETRRASYKSIMMHVWSSPQRVPLYLGSARPPPSSSYLHLSPFEVKRWSPHLPPDVSWSCCSEACAMMFPLQGTPVALPG
jgi:hypothetical protein